MTDIAEILKAKSDAIGALVEAFNQAADDGRVNDLASARNFLGTWSAAVFDMVPVEAYAAGTTPNQMAEPVEVGARVIDADGEVWQRFSEPTDSPWGLVIYRNGQTSARFNGSANWADVLLYNPRPI